MFCFQIFKSKLLKVFLIFFCLNGWADSQKLNVVTSTKTLSSLVKTVGKERVKALSLTRGNQNPHFHVAKPSYMLRVRKADLFVLVGMDLEIGWLPNILQGARNPSIQKGKPGYLDTSLFIEALGVHEGRVDRFFGDIHPLGNPHFLLDPLRAVQVAKGIRDRLSKLDPKGKEIYFKNQKDFEKRIQKKTKEWKKRIKKSGVKNIVSYHSSFEYFLNRFGLHQLAFVEEKPGIPPSARHLSKLIKNLKSHKNLCLLISSFYNKNKIKKITESHPIPVQRVAIEVGALKKSKKYMEMMENIVQAVEACGRWNKDKKQ